MQSNSKANTVSDSEYELYNYTANMHYKPTPGAREHYDLTTPVTDSLIHNINKRSFPLEQGETITIIGHRHLHYLIWGRSYMNKNSVQV